MCKKLIVTGLVAGVAAILVFRGEAISYVKTSAGWIKDSVKQNVPIEFQIERAEDMVGDVDGEIRRAKEGVATSVVQLRRLEKKVASLQESQDKSKTDLMRLKADVSSGQQFVSYGGRNFTIEQVKVDLTHRFARHKKNDEALASLKETVSLRQRAVDGAKQKVAALEAEREELLANIGLLKARVEEVGALKAASEFNFDDTRIGRVRDLVDELQARLDVDEELAMAHGGSFGEIPLDELAPETIADEVTAYFSTEPGQVAVSPTPELSK